MRIPRAVRITCEIMNQGNTGQPQSVQAKLQVDVPEDLFMRAGVELAVFIAPLIENTRSAVKRLKEL